MNGAHTTPDTAGRNGKDSRIDLRIEGMTCASCVARVESALKSVPGVASARVNLATETASVHTATPTDSRQLVRAVQSAGYDAIPAATSRWDTSPQRRQEQNLRERRQAVVISLGIGLPIIALHYAAPALADTHAGAHFWPMLLQGLLMVMLLISPAGGPILVGGMRALLHRSANMDLLIALGVLAATIGSFAALLVPRLEPINYFHDAAMILAFINVGKYLEARARMRAGSSLSALLQRAPHRAMRIDENGPCEVPIEEVKVRDRLQVAAESYVPVDGRVLAGHAALDLSMWTGETAPVEVEAGAEVLGGAYVYSGAMTVEATAVGADSAIARITRMVEEAQAGKTRMQTLADRIAAVFVPIVVALALLTAVAWLVLRHDGAHAWSAMIAVLVVACPCAMGLATPTAVMVATASAALRGIIVRDPAALESAATCDAALLDKTGTVTTGKLEVASIHTHADMTEHDLLRHAAAAEQFSPHPLAKAIVDAARARGIDLPEPSEYEASAGLGVTALIDQHRIHVGSAKYLEQSKTLVEASTLATEPEAQARVSSSQRSELPKNAPAPAMSHKMRSNAQYDMEDTPPGTRIFVAIDDRLAGEIVLHDMPRPAAADAIARLKSLGLKPVLVTGDQEAVARYVAQQVGIEEVNAGVSPPGKADLVRRLQAAGHRVLMVGDGVNDAPALAAADAAIAMTGGTQVAAETAAIALVGDRIELIPDSIELARQSVRIIRQNLFWAFAYNIIAIPLAMLLILPAAYAAAAMMVSSITVVLNSLRLQRFAPHPASSP